MFLYSNAHCINVVWKYPSVVLCFYIKGQLGYTESFFHFFIMLGLICKIDKSKHKTLSNIRRLYCIIATIHKGLYAFMLFQKPLEQVY